MRFLDGWQYLWLAKLSKIIRGHYSPNWGRRFFRSPSRARSRHCHAGIEWRILNARMMQNTCGMCTCLIQQTAICKNYTVHIGKYSPAASASVQKRKMRNDARATENRTAWIANRKRGVENKRVFVFLFQLTSQFSIKGSPTYRAAPWAYFVCNLKQKLGVQTHNS